MWARHDLIHNETSHRVREERREQQRIEKIDRYLAKVRKKGHRHTSGA